MVAVETTPSGNPFALPRRGGFSLIELVITVVILMGLVIAVASTLRSSFDIKAGLSDEARVIHRLQTAMARLADDVQHTFFVSAKDVVRNGIARNMKTQFKLDKAGGADRLVLTTRTHQARLAGAPESEFTMVAYELQDSKELSGRKNLYRGEWPWIPADLKEEPPMRLLAKNIKTFSIEAWTGEKWSKDYWDTGRGDTRNRLPKMVKITLEAWLNDRDPEESVDEALEARTETLSSVIYLEDASEYAELKEQDKTIRWSAM